MLTSQEFRKEYPEQNIQDLPMFRFDQNNATDIPQVMPHYLQDYQTHLKHSQSSPNNRIVELENELQIRTEEVGYLRTKIQDMQNTQDKLQQHLQELQKDYESVSQNFFRTFEQKNLQYQKFIELSKINKVLSHENGLYRSIERMKEFNIR